MSDETTRTDADTGNDNDTPTDAHEPQRRVSRRNFLRAGAASSLAAATAYTVVLPGTHEDTQAAPAPDAVIPLAAVQQTMPEAMNHLSGYTFFNPLMVDVISAAADRIIPADALSPSATDSGVVYFIDRQLSSEYGFTGKRYSAGPFAAGTPTQGDQLALSMRDRYRLGVDGMQAYAQKKYGKDFKNLAPNEQDQILRDMEAGTATNFTGITPAAFFQLFLSHVKAGFFADPIYGGNRDMVGWKMIGYPGAQIVYQDYIGRYGAKFPEPTMSLADHQEALHAKPGATQPAGMAGMAGMPAPATTNAMQPPASPMSATMPTAQAQGMATGRTVNVEMKDFAFVLSTSTVSAGTVTFDITATGKAPHNLAFPSLNKVSATITSGKTMFTVDFTPGMYYYICNIPGHEQLGMKGTLTVR